MSCLPAHGRVACDVCHRQPTEFDRTRTEEGEWRITANPLAWGGSRPEVVVLGFSKGPNALGALATKPHNDIPYAGQRLAVAKILAHVGLLPKGEPDAMRAAVAEAISDTEGRFAWGSLIRCTVERREGDTWKGSGGGMLDRFLATGFGERVATSCARRHLGNLPPETKLVVLFGLGTKLGYVRAARQVIQGARPGASWRTVNDVAYTDGCVVFVHVEHFASQGRLIPDWLGTPDTGGRIPKRAHLGRMAREAVAEAGVS